MRTPAVAGGFYPGDPAVLDRTVSELLDSAEGGEGGAPVALVAPHAGYAFSGAVAARAFAGLDPEATHRVILLGPSHHQGFAGAALPERGVTAFATPLGEVPIDLATVAELRACRDFGGPGAAHGPEHSLEVELPFVQQLAPAAAIVPILVGHATDHPTARRIAQCVAKVVDPGTVVVASSDFTHHGRAFGFAPFAGSPELGDTLLALGRETASRVAAVDPRGFSNQVEVSGDTVCGGRPVTVLLELLAHAFEGGGSVAAVTTSGHVAGGWDRVVTYAAVRFEGRWTPWHEDESETLGELSRDQGEALLELARATLESHLGHDASLARWYSDHQVAGQLEAAAGAFVTLNHRPSDGEAHGALRACMGVIEAREPLVDAAVHAAVSAAHDPRFPPLERGELGGLEVEVSVLSPTRLVAGPEAIEVGRHGVVMSKGGRRAVFLPQVATEQGWDRETMLDHLARKAGLQSDAWRHGATFEVFTAQVFSEADRGRDR